MFAHKCYCPFRSFGRLRSRQVQMKPMEGAGFLLGCLECPVFQWVGCVFIRHGPFSSNVCGPRLHPSVSLLMVALFLAQCSVRALPVFLRVKLPKSVTWTTVVLRPKGQ